MPMIEVNGARVEYDRVGSGPDLLLIHSLLTELTVYDRVLAAFAASHRVTRINMPGFGASSAVTLASVADYADHVARVMDALELPSTADVLGNGFGAFVVVELGIRHGDRFAGLVVADTLAAFPEPARVPFRVMAGKVRAGGMPAVLDTAIGRMFPPAFAAANPALVEERRLRLAPVDAQCFAQACLALAELDLRPRLALVRNRTLVMCGALDQTTPPNLARELAAAIPGARYVEIPGSGHCPMVEQPQAFIDAVQAFLRRT